MAGGTSQNSACHSVLKNKNQGGSRVHLKHAYLPCMKLAFALPPSNPGSNYPKLLLNHLSHITIVTWSSFMFQRLIRTKSDSLGGAEYGGWYTAHIRLFLYKNKIYLTLKTSVFFLSFPFSFFFKIFRDITSREAKDCCTTK